MKTKPDYNSTITVTWQVEDGYVGSRRPQKFTEKISDHFFDNEEWEEKTDEDYQEWLDDMVWNEFDTKISYSIENVEEH